MTDYRNLPVKLPNKGLDIVSPPDTLEEGRYTILNNVKNTQEGVLTTRDGLVTQYILPGTGNVHTIRRLDSSNLFFSRTDGSILRNEVALSLAGLPGNPTLSGNPLTTVRFRTALTGSTFMYVADRNVLFKARSDGTIYKWGITAPTAPPSFIAGGAGNLDGDYDWRFTYYSTITGAESNPSPTGTQITLSNQQAIISGMPASADAQVNEKRIYRRGGTITETWQFVAAITNTTTDYVDNFADDDIFENEPLSEDNDVPFSTVDSSGNTLRETPLPFIFGPFIGKYILACGDPNRPGYVYWTNPDMPDASAPENNLSVTNPAEPLQNGFIFNENPYVWTRDNLFTLDYGGPDAIPTFIPRLVSIGLGLSAPFAFAIGNSAVFFFSKDGIYATDCQSQLRSITDTSLRPIFLGKAAGSLQPIDHDFPNDIRLFYAAQEIHFFYKATDGNVIHLVYDLPFDRWRQFSTGPAPHTFGYGDENQSAYTLLLTQLNTGRTEAVTVGITEDSGTAIATRIRTGSQDAGIPLTEKEWGVLLVDADPTGADFGMLVTPYLNAETVALPTIILTGTGRQVFSVPLGDVYSRNIAFDVQWIGTGTLYQLLLLFRVDEEPVTHWEHPETSHGINMGWTHIRDAFFCLRSTSDVTLTHSIDGVTYTYTLPSTGGQRRMIHVYLAPVRGKVHRWEMNSATTFKFYGEDTQIFIKPWNSALSYQPISPFGAPGQATFLRKEAGT